MNAKFAWAAIIVDACAYRTVWLAALLTSPYDLAVLQVTGSGQVPDVKELLNL